MNPCSPLDTPMRIYASFWRLLGIELKARRMSQNRICFDVLEWIRPSIWLITWSKNIIVPWSSRYPLRAPWSTPALCKTRLILLAIIVVQTLWMPCLHCACHHHATSFVFSHEIVTLIFFPASNISWANCLPSHLTHWHSSSFIKADCPHVLYLWVAMDHGRKF
jgi:hypothetical protein